MRAATQLTRASRPFSLNQTGTLSRRHLAHFVAAVDSLNGLRAGLWIPQVVGGNELLVEGGEIGGPLRFAEIDQHGAVLPHVVVVVGIVAVAMQEAAGRSLVQVSVVDAVALAVEAAEHIDVRLLLLRPDQQTL